MRRRKVATAAGSESGPADDSPTYDDNLVLTALAKR